jgi:hypothetical protein
MRHTKRIAGALSVRWYDEEPGRYYVVTAVRRTSCLRIGEAHPTFDAAKATAEALHAKQAADPLRIISGP